LLARSRPAVPAAALSDWLARPAALRRLGAPPATGVLARRTTVEPHGSGALLTDEVEVDPAAPAAVRERLERWLARRHRILAADLARFERFAGQPRRTIAVSGASGLVGSALVAFLDAAGHRVRPFVRGAAGPPGAIHWDPARGTIDGAALAGVDAVVHLAGESVAGGRWTAARKERIRASRVRGTATIANALVALAPRPAVLVSASAIGYYGDRGEEWLDESSGAGHGFLADVCREWESATEPAARSGIRVVHARIGIVLAEAGGALARMLAPFRLGLGGRLGSGRQFMSWIALDDAIGAIHHALGEPALTGPVNVVGPDPLRNAEFARALGGVLGRPALLPVPGAAVRVLLGAMGRELLLAGARVRPARLLGSGFRFEHAALAGALAFELGLARGATGVDIEWTGTGVSSG
jgi:uncharacterized protein (TIGR01777 family)